MLKDKASRDYWNYELSKLLEDDWPYIKLKISRGNAKTKTLSLPFNEGFEALLSIDFLSQSKEVFNRYEENIEESLKIIREQRETIKNLKKQLKEV